MAVRVLSAVWDGYPGGGPELLALLALADWSDDQGRCYPSIAAIARKVRLGEKQARRIVHRLIESGVVRVAGNDVGGRSSRRYQIILATLTPPLDGRAPEKGRAPLDDTPPLPPMGGHPSLSYGSRTVIDTSVEPKGSAHAGASADQASPMSAKDQVWTLGPALLGEKARGLLGKLVATHGEDLLAEVLGDCAREKPGEPKAWIVATCAARQKVAKSGAGGASGLMSNPTPQWALSAGFTNRFEAENAGCTERNHRQFAKGKKVAA